MQVIKDIDRIAIGDGLSNTSGLTLLVRNPALSEFIVIPAPVETLTLQEQIAKRMAAITYFTVSQSSITNNMIDLQ